MESLAKGKFYLTVPGADRLEQELETLQKKRGEVAQNIRTAKAYGDLSENFEYHEAKREQGFVESRIHQLKQILASVEVIRPEEVDGAVVGFGAVVSVREDTGDELDYYIVGPLEADPVEDRISYASPLGAALLGTRAGDVVEANVPAGTVRLEVVAIRPYEL